MKKIFVLIMILFGYLGTSFGYFEDKYYCNISDSSISIGLKKLNGYIKCMDEVRDISHKLLSVEINIDSAQTYIDNGEDVGYWKTLRFQLLANKQSLKESRDNIISYMDNFEQALFLKLKKALYFHLSKDRKNIDQNIIKYNGLLKSNLKFGNTLDYMENKQILDVLLQKKLLIDKSLGSNNFGEMIPYLRLYMSL